MAKKKAKKSRSKKARPHVGKRALAAVAKLAARVKKHVKKHAAKLRRKPARKSR